MLNQSTHTVTTVKTVSPITYTVLVRTEDVKHCSIQSSYNSTDLPTRHGHRQKRYARTVRSTSNDKAWYNRMSPYTDIPPRWPWCSL